ncbi:MULTISPECIES: hypothetical protein [Bacteroides]|uniref:hypothetical protein n=1 Tax=Bacteroides TaxID=816 RepID=UPI0025B5960F|nr:MULTISPECIES: hypothetical protein [Bacteroides]
MIIRIIFYKDNKNNRPAAKSGENTLLLAAGRFLLEDRIRENSRLLAIGGKNSPLMAKCRRHFEAGVAICEIEL